MSARGAEDPATLRACHTLALCLADQEKNPEALTYAQRALDGWQKVLGKDHRETQQARSLVDDLKKKKKKKDAKA